MPVAAEHSSELPLPAQGTVSDADRYSKGLAEQTPLYGNKIKGNLADLPEPFTRPCRSSALLPHIGFPGAVAAIRAVKNL
jgi:hypothetical protein